MHTREYCLAVMVVSALFGCKSGMIDPGGGPLTRINCPNEKCDFIDVVVEESGTTQNPQCKVTSVSIPEASVAGLPAGDKEIRWRLPPNSPYEFSKADYKFGIFIKSGADPTGKFLNATVNGDTLTIKFRHRAQDDAKRYSYSITVRRSSNSNPQFCETLDPFLVG